MRFTISTTALAALRMHAAEDWGLECCGLLLGRGGRIEEARPAANVAADPARTFEVDPTVLIAAYRAARGGGRQVIGAYHSHPSGVAIPSAWDAEMAEEGRLVVIVTQGAVTGWMMRAGGFGAVELVEASEQAQTSTGSA